MANVAEVNSTMYTDIAEAVKNAKSGETVRLLDNIDYNTDIWVSNDITIDLNEKTWKFGADCLIGILGNNVVIENGTITQTKGSERYSVIQVGATNIGANTPVLTTKNVKISGDTGIIVMGAPSVVNVENGSEISGIHFGIATNGKDAGTTINVKGGTVTGPDKSCGIYLPSGTLNISGGTVTGGSGVVIRGGYLTMSEGTVISTGTDTIEVGDSGAGLPPAGISIDKNMKYNNGNVNVEITGGRVEGIENAVVYTDNGQSSDATTVEGIEITGGVFSGNVLNAAVESAGYLYELIESKTDELNDRVDTVYGTLESFADDIIKLKAEDTSIKEAASDLEGKVTSNTEKIGTMETTISGIEASLAENAGMIDSLENTTSGLSDRIGTVETNLGTTDEKVTTLESTVNGISENVSTIEGNVTNLSSDLSDVETNVSNLTEKVNTIETNLQDTDSKVQEVETKANNVESDLASTDQKVTDIGDRLDITDSNLSSLTQKVTENEENITSLQSKTDNTDNKVTELETNLGTTDGKVSTVESTVEEVQSSVNDLSEKVNNVEELKTVVDEIESSIETLKKDIEELKPDEEDPLDDITVRLTAVEDSLTAVKELVDRWASEEDEATKPFVMPTNVVEAMVTQILTRCKEYMDAKLPVSSDSESVEDLVARLDERYVHQDDIL